MTNSQPTVGIVIVTYNSEAQLDALAASIAALTCPSYHLYIVDNASTDATPERLASVFPSATIILSADNLGFSHGVNQGLSRALADGVDYVLLLNPDATLAPDVLDLLVARADPRSLVVPAVWSSRTGRFMNQPGRFDWRGLHVAPRPGADSLDVAGFACVLLPAEVFRAVGPLDEAFGMYYEDTDYCLQARKAGFRIVEERRAEVRHWGGASSGGWGSPFTQYYSVRNRIYIVRRHSALLPFFAFCGWFFVTRCQRIAVHIKHRDWLQLRCQVLALRDVCLGRMGMTYTTADLNKGWTPYESRVRVKSQP